MANGRDDMAVLATDIATSPLRTLELSADPHGDLEPVHFTTRGYESLIRSAAAQQRRRYAETTT